VSNLNGADDGTSPILVVTEIALLDGAGKPLIDASGKPRVRRLADCDRVIDKDTCRELFIDVSNCKIRPPDGRDAEACAKDKIAAWYDANSGTLDEPR